MGVCAFVRGLVNNVFFLLSYPLVIGFFPVWVYRIGGVKKFSSCVLLALIPTCVLTLLAVAYYTGSKNIIGLEEWIKVIEGFLLISSIILWYPIPVMFMGAFFSHYLFHREK